jgi:hypothetical protein
MLDSINDQERSDIGRYAGWGIEDSADSAPVKDERSGAGMMPFLRYRFGDRWWNVGIGLAYVPAIIAVVSIESWLGLRQSVIWISLGVFYVAFMVTIYLVERSRPKTP